MPRIKIKRRNYVYFNNLKRIKLLLTQIDNGFFTILSIYKGTQYSLLNFLSDIFKTLGKTAESGKVKSFRSYHVSNFRHEGKRNIPKNFISDTRETPRTEISFEKSIPPFFMYIYRYFGNVALKMLIREKLNCPRTYQTLYKRRLDITFKSYSLCK